MLSLKPIVDDADESPREDACMKTSCSTSPATSAPTRYARIADIINKMERGHIEDMLKSLSEKRPKSAEVLKEPALHLRRHRQSHPEGAHHRSSTRCRPISIVLALKGTDRRFPRDSSCPRSPRASAASSSTNWPSASRRRSATCWRRAASITDLALEMAEQGEIELNPERGGRAGLSARPLNGHGRSIRSRRAKQKSRPRRRSATRSRQGKIPSLGRLRSSPRWSAS